ncbi:hypothetical protein BH11ARM2_BH11ARM2_12070 [soil metagenome]
MKIVLTFVVMAGLLYFIYYLLFPPATTPALISQNNRATALNAFCLVRTRQAAIGLVVYAEDADGHFPQQSDWTDATSRFVKYDASFRCPLLPKGAFGYAFNSTLSEGRMPKNPESTILVFESTKPERNVSDPFTSFPKPGRHEGKGNLAYADGHVKSVTP